MTDPNDLSKYIQMHEDGLSPEEIYIAAKADLRHQLKALWFVRHIFQVNLDEARSIVERGDKLYLERYVAQKYVELRLSGKSFGEVYTIMRADESISQIDRIKVLMHVFGLDLKSVMAQISAL